MARYKITLYDLYTDSQRVEYVSAHTEAEARSLVLSASSALRYFIQTVRREAAADAA